MKIIAFSFSKAKFPNAFLEHPGFSKSDWFLYHKTALLAKHAWSARPKEGWFSLLRAFHSLYSAIISPLVFHLQGRVFWVFLLLCSILCSLSFHRPFSVESLEGRMRLFLLVISQDPRFSSWLQAVPLAWSSTCHAL